VVSSLSPTVVIPVAASSVASTAYTSPTLGALAVPSERSTFPRIRVQPQRQRRTGTKPNILYVMEFESGLTGHSNGPTKPISSRSTSSTSRTAGSEEKDKKTTVTFASYINNKGETFFRRSAY
jgi:hypothetical protein